MKRIFLTCQFIMLSFLICATLNAATLNVTDFGAVTGDDGDDLAAINSAITGASSGDTIFLPSGKYLINGLINVKSGVNILGASKESTVIEYISEVQDAMISLSSVSNVEISNMTLKGNVFSTKGIVATNGSKLFIHDMIIKDFTSTVETFILGIHFGTKVTESTISDNIIENIGVGSKWGGGIRLSWGCTNNFILRNKVTKTGRGGIFADNGSHSNVYRENTVSGCGKTAEGLGLEIWVDCGNSIIEDNVLDHWLSVAGSSNTAVRRNVVSAKDTTYASCGIELVESDNCVLTDNTVDEGAHIGISISGTPQKNNVYWAYNTIRHCTTWGMQMQGEDGGTNRHYFYGNKFNDTYMDHPKSLYPPQGHGARFNGNDFNITFEANEFSSNGRSALQFLGNLESFSFTGNIISKNRSIFNGDFSGTNLEFVNNTCTGNMSGNFIPASKGFTNKKPAADYSFILKGLEVRFNNASSDSDGSISYCLWDFNDGLPSTETNPIHVFDKEGVYRVALIVWDDSGRGARIEKEITVSNVVSVDEDNNSGSNKPVDFALSQNCPNPFNSSTSIRFTNRVPGHALFSLHNIAGQRIAVLADGYYPSGEHEIKVDASGLSTGVYIVKMVAGGYVSSIKMLYLR